MSHLGKQTEKARNNAQRQNKKGDLRGGEACHEKFFYVVSLLHRGVIFACLSHLYHFKLAG